MKPYTNSELSEVSEFFKNDYDFEQCLIIDWDELSKIQKLSEEFIEKYRNKVSWDNIFAYQQLSEKFIDYIIQKYYDKELKNKLNIFNLLENQKVSETFIEKHILNISSKLLFIIKNQTVSEEFIMKYINECDDYTIQFILNNKIKKPDNIKCLQLKIL